MDLLYFQQSTKYPKPQNFNLLEYCNVLTPQDFDYVYTPGDDSYLMLSILNQQIKHKQLQNPQVILEIGSGSGILLAHLFQWLKQQGMPPALAFSTDINIEACIVSKKYYQIICTSMMNSLRLKPDIIVFNPPYIPSDTQQQQKQKAKYELKMQQLKKGLIQRTYDNNMIAYSWMGGTDGLKTVWQLLDIVQWKCSIYLVVIDQNPIDKLKIVSETKGFKFTVLGYKHKYNQRIFIVKLVKQ